MRHLATIAAGILTAVLFCAAPARAQSASPDAMAAAKELVEASKTTDGFKTLLPMIMQQIKPVVVQKRPAVEKDFDQIVPLMIEAANEQVGKFAEAVAVIWASNFTADELRQVIRVLSHAGRTEISRADAGDRAAKHGHGPEIRRKLMNDLQARMKDELASAATRS